jgi:CRP/FNR family transcriptional regulator, anaerobic regulatory protein
MEALQLYLKNWFQLADEAEITHIASRFRPLALAKGEFLLKTGRYCQQLAFVDSGLLRIFTNADEKEVTQWISSPGYFVTDLSGFLFEQPARWSIQALTDAELFAILGQDLPRWHQLEKMLLAKCFTILENRIFSHLSMTAEERYHHFLQQQPHLFNQVPLQYIASMLGMTPETFSRIRKKQTGG